MSESAGKAPLAANHHKYLLRLLLTNTHRCCIIPRVSLWYEELFDARLLH